MRFLLIIGMFQLFLSTHVTAQSDRKILIPYRLQDKWGFSDTLGRIMIEPVYDSVGFFSGDRTKDREELAWVTKNEKQGAVNKNGQLILEAMYDSVAINSRNKFCLTELNGKKSIISINGQIIIPPNYDHLVFDPLVKGFIVGRNNKRSFRDMAGRVIAPMIYDSIYTVDNFEPNEDLIIGIIGANKFKILKNGKRIPIKSPKEANAPDLYLLDDSDLNAKDESDAHLFHRAASIQKKLSLSEIDVETYKVDGYFLVSKNNKVGLIRHDETRSIPIEYDTIFDLHISDSVYEGKGGYDFNPCYIREDGTCMDLFWVKKNGKVGIIDHKNRIVLPFVYDGFNGSNYYQPLANGKVGLIVFRDNSLKLRFKCEYDYIKYEHWIYLEGSWVFSIYKVKKNGQWGFAGENSLDFFQN